MKMRNGKGAPVVPALRCHSRPTSLADRPVDRAVRAGVEGVGCGKRCAGSVRCGADDVAPVYAEGRSVVSAVRDVVLRGVAEAERRIRYPVALLEREVRGAADGDGIVGAGGGEELAPDASRALKMTGPEPTTPSFVSFVAGVNTSEATTGFSVTEMLLTPVVMVWVTVFNERGVPVPFVA